MGWSDRFSRGISRQIEEAQKKGLFEDLPGKGKPLNLMENPNADKERDLAYKLLQDNDFSLPWIEKGQQIDKELDAARRSLELTWALYNQAESDQSWVSEEWVRAKNVFRSRLADLNKLIRDYNLEIPNLRFERFILDIEVEIEKIKQKK